MVRTIWEAVVTVFRSVALATLTMIACGGPSAPSSVDGGTWGGDHVMLTVTDTGNHFEFDCAHGDVPGRLTANHGVIAANGTFVREHGGPIRVDEPIDAHPALYSGTLAATTWQLSIRLTDSGDVVGSFSLTRGATGRVAKCL